MRLVAFPGISVQVVASWFPVYFGLTGLGGKRKAKSGKVEGAIKIIQKMTAKTWMRDKARLLEMLAPVKGGAS